MPLRPHTLALSGLALLLSACASLPPPPPASANAQQPPQSLGIKPSIAPLDPPPVASARAAMPQVEDDVQPGSQVNLDDSAARDDLWERIRRGFAMPDLDNEGVSRAEAWYRDRPDYVARMTERGSRYLYHIVVEVEKRGMPMELALLPFIESAFNPHAVSSAKATGMWQFMPATGRDFDLKQNIFRDDRRDVLASTRAALDYLGRLHAMFGDWHLALAAYNWGQGNVQRAIARNQKAGRPTDYESLRMPDETRFYVPKLQAVKNIVLRPQAFALTLPPVANHPYFLSVAIDRDIDVEVAARLADMPLDRFKQFNPQANKPVLLAAAGSKVLLPYDNAEAFARNLAAHRGPLASWTAWVLPRTMKPGEAAREVGMSEEALRELNRIPPRMLVKAGSTLLVPRSGKRDQDVSEHLADNASISLAPDAPPLRRVSLKAGKGETVASVARRYKLSTSQVAQWNKVSPQASFKTGQTLVVYLAAKPRVEKGRVSRGAGAKIARSTPNGARASVKTARSVAGVQKPSKR
ncbi:MAG: transglycosylase SLT domain-containing protein [Roseateles asaccharophilus]|uniref:Membrane-bound lytic murein transglycosylase D n=1 Tax=Roseateles asaccharophilus TaxID=582607 RepID=A0A4R6N955_9BURK|nr:transglycosylase SLT domain-containing protein [Roseateles asaccharophilus]MDN3543822.1 transglycosylase SLT domain-containing protein [Roseateles asaccharophilus]TDP11800.1 membrane-bound lytic murein transglycosylase D [Roseateles asaccharophilus]